MAMKIHVVVFCVLLPCSDVLGLQHHYTEDFAPMNSLVRD